MIAYIEVSGDRVTPSPLPPFEPVRPDYLENLMPGHYDGHLPYQQYPSSDGNVYDYWPNMEVSGGSIAGENFHGEHNYLQVLDINKVHIWEVTGSPDNPDFVQNAPNNVHPLHVHINHFQMINSTLNSMSPPYTPQNYGNYIEIPEGYQVPGDFMDTIWGPGFITFKTSTFGGTVAVHCHVLTHEDQGSMGTVCVRGGCDGDWIEADNVTCEYVDTCTRSDNADDFPFAVVMIASGLFLCGCLALIAFYVHKRKKQEASKSMKLIIKETQMYS